ncbi:hypothetical protein B6U80_00245 [Candidatus Pacearchaeota archaeon ex4484_26]|nr:MAG: hypothetical protein B6U80_00245 [Candidatus Pacearchaeota archaeon ex4484_26]
MVNTAGMLKCNRCGKSFHVRSMIADPSGKGLICQKCYELVSKVRTDADKLIQRKVVAAEQSIKAKKKAIRETAERIKQGKEYVCKACNYHFISALPVKKCPYCGREGTLKVMENLTKEIDDILKG